MATLTINNSICNIVPCVEYGFLYNWYAATHTGGISSDDNWFVPTHEQISEFITYIGGTSVSYKLRDTNLVYWNESAYEATNEFEFNARGAGARYSSAIFQYLREWMIIWSSTSLSTDYARNREFSYINQISSNATYKYFGFSIRLVSDATGIPDGTTTTYTGNDGHVYNAIAINELYWITENLIETQYRNGDTIPTVEDNTTWAGLTSGAKCAYDNNYAYVGCGVTG